MTARPGHHQAPQLLSSGRNVFEELGTGYTLLGFDADDGAVEVIQQAAKTLMVPLTVVRDNYDGERKAYESRLVLVRPDQFVAWTGDESGDATGMLRRVAGIF